MHLLARRYARSSYAPPWFLWLLGVGFGVLAVWAAVEGDWLVLALAMLMVVVSLAVVALARRLGEALHRSQRAIERERNTPHG